MPHPTAARRSPSVLWVARPGPAATALAGRMRAHGLGVSSAPDVESALEGLERGGFDALVVSLAAPRPDAMRLLRRARERDPAVGVVLIARSSRQLRPAEFLREGAWDVLAHPPDAERLLAVLDRGFAQRRLAARLAELEGAGSDPAAGRFDGRSAALARVVEQIRHLASTHVAVLIEGEDGTGKTRAARMIHRHSTRRAGPFVPLDCGAAGPAGLESELFGEDGSGGTPGRLEQAEGGTLFLGRVENAPPAVQVRLLRLLQDRSFERVGGRTPLRADVRTIASSRDLSARVEQGRFRPDLLQRLGAVRVAMPALRERREDIPWLVERLLREANRRHRRRLRGVTRGVLDRLQRHPWPGNVRELKETIDGMVASAAGNRPLDLSDLPAHLREGRGEPEGIDIAPGMTVEEAERLLIAATLERVGHDKPRAAAMLGIGLRTLYRKIRAYGLR